WKEAKRVADIFYPLAASRKPLKSLENTNIHKKGHLVILETSGVPFYNSDGAFRGYRGIDRDITERKKIENDVKERVAELEGFYEMSVSRELRMKELKNKIENLEYELIQFRR
ncbi:MAG: PAS domain S-box protein, partial [Nitrospiraceae bacterium]